MDSYRLGNTSVRLSPITLGCWSFAGDANWGEQEESRSIETMRSALDLGVTTFDNAPAYGDGKSEELLGKALEGRRNEAVIATKLPMGRKITCYDDMARAVEESLERLRTDYIDLLQLHWPDREAGMELIVEGMEKLVDAGKIRAYGVCNFGVGDLGDWLEHGTLVSNQLPYSLLWRAIEFEIQPVCVEQGIGILCYSSLLQGLLTGKFATADEVPEGRARTRHFSSSRSKVRHSESGCEALTFGTIDRLRAISRESGFPMEALSLAWLRQQPAVATVIAGARDPGQIRSNVDAIGTTLDDATLIELSAVSDPLKEALGPNPDLWQSESRFR